MTTREPGAREVFTHGLVARPRSAAFLASRAAAIITSGLEVLVQEVIAAITTAAWPPWRAGRRAEAGWFVGVPVAGDRDRVGGREGLGAGFVQPGRVRLARG